MNGRVRGRLRESAELDEKELLQQALAVPGVVRQVNGQRIAETVVVTKKLINIVLACSPFLCRCNSALRSG